MNDISQFQKEGSDKAGALRTLRSQAVQMLKDGELTIEELIDASVFEKAYHTITIKKALDALKIEKVVQNEIFNNTGLKPDRKIGTLTSEKSANKKKLLIEAINADYHPAEGWPWTSTFS